MDIKDYLVLIGQQATGKSTVSKLIYFFRTVKDEMYRHFEEEIRSPEGIKRILEYSKRDFLNDMNDKLVMLFGSTSKNKESLIRYNYGNNITITLATEINKSGKYILKIGINRALQKKFKIFFHKGAAISQRLQLLVENMVTPISDVERAIRQKEGLSYFNMLQHEIRELFNDYSDAVYIPAGRSTATVFYNKLYGQTINTDDYLLERYFMRNHDYRNLIERERAKMGLDIALNGDYAENFIKEILKGDYRYIREIDEERLYISKDEYITMQLASSGQQESLWILLTLRVLLNFKQKVLFIVEEPEAHLYPKAQRKLVELISYVMNATNSQMIITTHSPYILTSLNNLIFANNVAKKSGKESEVSAIVDKRLWIDIDKIGVFELENGECSDIVSRRLNFIKAEAIDKASDEIEEIYEKILDIK
ncbi:MAG: ATP-binding protein [Nitrospirota bacterium]